MSNDIPKLTVVPFPGVSVKDISRMLRSLADDIDSKAVDADEVVVLLRGEGFHIYGMGDCTSMSAVYLMQAGINRFTNDFLYQNGYTPD